MKKVTIVGAGEIGAFLAGRLDSEKLAVTVIDRNAELLSALQNTLDVAVIHGDATSIKDLARADVRESDYFIATTRQDETNLISCLLAHQLGTPHKIAVTRYLGLRGQKSRFDSRPLGIDLMVNSSEAVKNEIMDVLETTGASEVATFAQGRIVLVGAQIAADSPVRGRSVGEVCPTPGGEHTFRVVCILRERRLVEPTPATVLAEGDYLYLIATQDSLPLLNAALGLETIKSRTAVIYGDNFLSQLTATALLNRHFQVTMLVATQEKATFLKEHFANRRHFHVERGEATEVRLQRRVKVPTTSVFVATKSDDASNLTACMIAKHLGVGKTIATIKRTDILPLCREAGVDVNVAPRLATAKVIQRMIHEGSVLEYRAVSQVNLEVVELEVRERSKALRHPLGQLRLPEGVIVGGIVREGVPALPTPETRMEVHDKVIVLTPPEHLVEVEALFGA